MNAFDSVTTRILPSLLTFVASSCFLNVLAILPSFCKRNTSLLESSGFSSAFIILQSLGEEIFFLVSSISEDMNSMNLSSLFRINSMSFTSSDKDLISLSTWRESVLVSLRSCIERIYPACSSSILKALVSSSLADFSSSELRIIEIHLSISTNTAEIAFWIRSLCFLSSSL